MRPLQVGDVVEWWPTRTFPGSPDAIPGTRGVITGFNPDGDPYIDTTFGNPSGSWAREVWQLSKRHYVKQFIASCLK